MNEEINKYNIIVFTDGACSKNGYSNACAGLGVYFGENDKRNFSEKIEGKQTNNVAELSAIYKALIIVEKQLQIGENILIVSDSEYSIRCCTSYGKKNYDQNWKKDFPNKELVKIIYEKILHYSNQIFFKHVFSHTGKEDFFSKGNDHADKLANKAIGVTSCPYEKIYLKVSYEEKDDAKLLGAKWDFKKKKWFIDKNVTNENKKKLIELYSL
jgi:ribonuclease HI